MAGQFQTSGQFSLAALRTFFVSQGVIAGSSPLGYSLGDYYRGGPLVSAKNSSNADINLGVPSSAPISTSQLLGVVVPETYTLTNTTAPTLPAALQTYNNLTATAGIWTSSAGIASRTYAWQYWNGSAWVTDNTTTSTTKTGIDSSKVGTWRVVETVTDVDNHTAQAFSDNCIISHKPITITAATQLAATGWSVDNQFIYAPTYTAQPAVNSVLYEVQRWNGVGWVSQGTSANITFAPGQGGDFRVIAHLSNGFVTAQSVSNTSVISVPYVSVTSPVAIPATGNTYTDTIITAPVFSSAPSGVVSVSYEIQQYNGSVWEFRGTTNALYFRAATGGSYRVVATINNGKASTTSISNTCVITAATAVSGNGPGYTGNYVFGASTNRSHTARLRYMSDGDIEVGSAKGAAGLVTTKAGPDWFNPLTTNIIAGHKFRISWVYDSFLSTKGFSECSINGIPLSASTGTTGWLTEVDLFHNATASSQFASLMVDYTVEISADNGATVAATRTHSIFMETEA